MCLHKMKLLFFSISFKSVPEGLMRNMAPMTQNKQQIRTRINENSVNWRLSASPGDQWVKLNNGVQEQ